MRMWIFGHPPQGGGAKKIGIKCVFLLTQTVLISFHVWDDIKGSGKLMKKNENNQIDEWVGSFID